MDKEARKIIDFINYAEKLKVELRHASKSDGMHESVADHSWRLSLMLVLIVPKLKLKIDLLKALKMAVVHDLVEIESKDVPLLTYIDNKHLADEKDIREQRAIAKIRKVLGTSGEEIYQLWQEFEDLKTNEAKLVKALDRFEGEFQFLTETVTKFTKQEQKAIDILLKETTELAKIDPFLEKIDEISIEERKKRIQS